MEQPTTHYSLVAASASLLQDTESAVTKATRQESNKWKRRLIETWVPRGARVLDIACGRGGDVHKFAKLDPSLYMGVDISPEAVAEASRRWGVHGKKKTVHLFATCDASMPLEVVPRNLRARFTIATSFFAAHYFLKSDCGVRRWAEEMEQLLCKNGRVLLLLTYNMEVERRLSACGSHSWGDDTGGIRACTEASKHGCSNPDCELYPTHHFQLLPWVNCEEHSVPLLRVSKILAKRGWRQHMRDKYAPDETCVCADLLSMYRAVAWTLP